MSAADRLRYLRCDIVAVGDLPLRIPESVSPCVFISPAVTPRTSTPLGGISYQSASPNAIWKALFAQ